MKRTPLTRALLPTAGLLTAGLLAAGALVGPAAAMVVLPLEDAMKRALSAAPVEAQVTGDAIETLRRQIRAPRILARIQAVQDLGDGCKRLRATLSSPVAVDADGHTRPFVWDFEMNLCPDGSPPTQLSQEMP